MIQNYFKKKIAFVDKQLNALLPSEKTYPAVIHESMRYMVFSGGKRIRPILAIACCEACGSRATEVAHAACAIELVHTYSLIHDDLPCMDNDDYRRGKATCHRRYGIANAVLAGDALLTLAFDILSSGDCGRRSLRIINELGKAAGTLGMIGGQVVDKISENREVSLPLLDYINVHKTGKLIAVSCLIGAIASGTGKRKEQAILKYGEYLGFAFQVVDDIIDSDGYLRFMSKHEAYMRAEDLVQKAKDSVSILGPKKKKMVEIADFILTRNN